MFFTSFLLNIRKVVVLKIWKKILKMPNMRLEPVTREYFCMTKVPNTAPPIIEMTLFDIFFFFFKVNSNQRLSSSLTCTRVTRPVFKQNRFPRTYIGRDFLSLFHIYTLIKLASVCYIRSNPYFPLLSSTHDSNAKLWLVQIII